jgi:aquaporin Z
MGFRLQAAGFGPEALRALREHWPEYAIEGWALGMFMVSAGLFAVLLDYPGSSLHRAIADPTVRRILAGLAMGLTAIALIYSPWGKRSGAHMNPAVTLSFLRLGKIRRSDAFFYIASQVIGGVLGVLLVAAVFGPAFADPPVRFAATLPGSSGVLAAFVAEVAISAGMMAMILITAASARLAPYTGMFAGVLVATYISVEAPFSGMSMNPARSFASAAPGMLWESFWVYLSAPVLGMLLATQLHLRARGRARTPCAKLQHPDDVRCIHCGHEPARTSTRTLAPASTRSITP